MASKNKGSIHKELGIAIENMPKKKTKKDKKRAGK